MKKIFSLIMIAFIAFTSAFVGVAVFVMPNGDDTSETGGEVGVSWSGSGTSSSPYLITSASDLQTLATNVNAGNAYNGLYFLQTADIDLSGVSNWTPIGISSTYPFKGKYDGGNYRISNMTIATTANYRGLFGYYTTNVIADSYELCNIFLDNVNITGTNSYIGGLVGYCTGGDIHNCYVTGNIGGASYVGGLVGYNDGDVYASGSAAVIDATGSYVGGINGYLRISDSSECFNTGKVTSTGSYVGGINGYAYDWCQVENCYNTARITGKTGVGGIVGYYDGDTNTTYSYVKYCYNTGYVKATSTASPSAGGIVGSLYSSYVGSCWSYAAVESAGTTTNLGGIVGYNSGGGYDSYNYYHGVYTNGISTDKAGGTQTLDVQTKPKSSSWVGYTNWDLSSSSDSSVWHLASTAKANPTIRSAAWGEQGGTTENPFKISSVSDLRKLQFVTNIGVHYDGLNFKQTKSLDLSAYSDWIPIGYSASSLSSAPDFRGNYDGDNFTISNLKRTTTLAAASLFGNVLYSVIKNISLTNVSINNTSSGYAGGITACITSGKIENCHFEGSVKGVSTVGGVCSEASNSDIINCTAKGSVTSTEGQAGGIMGALSGGDKLSTIDNCINYATVSASYGAGGIAGSAWYSYSNVTNCYNIANITSSSTRCGGIMGLAQGNYSSSNYISIKYCYNSGTIKGAGDVGGVVGALCDYSQIYDCYNTGAVTGTGNYTGGVAGSVSCLSTNSSSASNPLKIVNCYNKANVTGTSYVGGIAGYLNSSCYFTMNYSYNVGKLSGSSYLGGLVGLKYGTLTTSGCYWDSDCGATIGCNNSSSTVGTGYSNLDSTTYAKNSSWSMYTSSWDFANVWMINSGMNDGYPILRVTFAVGSGGSGTSTDPFLISSLEDLQDLQKKVNAGTNYSGTYFKQTANIDMKNISSWVPIGSSATTIFAGNYNGDGCTIANLTVNNSSMYQGLFGHSAGATISNIRLLNVNISSSAYSGALVGIFSGNISNVSVSGTISGGAYLGGLVGSVAKTTTISECYNLSNITGNSSPIGGLVGGSTASLTIYDCYNKGNVTTSSGGTVGGLVGTSTAAMSIYRSYNTGTVKTTSGTAGGLVGGASSNSQASMYNCYNLGTVSGSYLGGLSAGYGTNSASYYESSCGATYGIRSGSSSVGKTTNLISQVNSKTWSGYSGWDFTANWLLIPTANGSLPVLKDFYWTGSGSGSESDPFKISSLANLQLLQSFVNKGEHYEGMYFSQTTSISLSSISEWTPIGDYATNDFLWFSGYYDQNDYSIQYLNITTNKNYRGLFGYAKNATFDDPYFIGSSSYVISVSGASYVGTLLGYGLNCKIDKYDSSSGPAITGGQYTGALAGYLGQGSVLTNSYLSQKVTGNGHYVGGMVGGLNASTMTGCYRSSSSSSYAINNSSYGYTGGLVGYSYNSTITNCYSFAPVTGNMHIGGIVGILDCGVISNSYYSTGKVTAANYAGGIAGQVYNTGKITACYNTGTVNATTKGAGGIAGLVAGTAKTKFATVEKSYNSGTVTGVANTGGLVGVLDDYADLLNCYNSGAVTGTGNYTGGLVGKIEAFEYNNTDSNYPTSIKYCFNKGVVKGTAYVGGIVGYITLDNTHATIAYSYNVGAVSSSSSATTIGGIAGYAPKSQTYSVMKFLTNYWDTDCGATYGVQNQTTVGGVTGYSALDTSTYALNSSWSLYSYWDFTNTWRILSNYNGGYPTFLWSLTKYTVYFYPNSGNESSYSITARYTEYITLPENTFTRAGFTANGWNKSSTLTATPSYKAGDSYKVTGTTSFYANWTPIGMTLNLKVYIEHDLNGKTYDLVTSEVSGLNVNFYYYNTTLSGSSTSYVQMKSTGAAVSGAARINQSITVYVTPPSGYICTDIVVNNESPTHSSKITSKTVSIGTGMSGYASSNYTGEVRVYIKKSSGNNVEFE